MFIFWLIITLNGCDILNYKVTIVVWLMRCLRGVTSRRTWAIFVLFLAAFYTVNGAVIPRENQSKDVVLQEGQTYYKRFLHGFLASVYVIIISELGDKTFFIAAILSVYHSRLLVYGGAMFALISMTVVSALLGYATELLPRFYTYLASGFLFILFGLKMLKDGK